MAGILEALKGQKEDTLVLSNHDRLVRNCVDKKKIGRSEDVLADLLEYPIFNEQYRKGKFNQNIMSLVRVPYNYGSSTAPMQNLFMVRKDNPKFVRRPIKETVANNGKNPVMVNAGRKAYKTRLRNQGKQKAGRKEIFTKKLCIKLIKKSDRTKVYLKHVCEEAGLSYGGVYMACKRHRLPTC